jgi:hypothetical protein
LKRYGPSWLISHGLPGGEIVSKAGPEPCGGAVGGHPLAATGLAKPGGAVRWSGRPGGPLTAYNWLDFQGPLS